MMIVEYSMPMDFITETAEEKLQLSLLGIEKFHTLYHSATDIEGNERHFPNLREVWSPTDYSKRILDQCSYIYVLDLFLLVLDKNLFDVLIETEAHIEKIVVCDGSVNLEVEDFIDLCTRFKGSEFKCKHKNPEIYQDEVLTQVLPFTVFSSGFFHRPDYEKHLAPLITNKTLKALIGGNNIPTHFCIKNVCNSFTICGIVEVLEIINQRKIKDLQWDLGILFPYQIGEAMRYFNGETGVLKEQYRITIDECKCGLNVEVTIQHPENGQDGKLMLVDYSTIRFGVWTPLEDHE